MKTLPILPVFCAGTIFFLSCSSGDGGNGTFQKNDSICLRQFLTAWNDAHNKRDSLVFEKQYEDTVSFYGANEARKKCISLKSSFFRKYPAFGQEIVGEIKMDLLSPNECKCSFGKKVTLKTNAVLYPAYLIFRKVNGDWKIKAESDLETDRYLEKRKEGISGEKQTIPG